MFNEQTIAVINFIVLHEKMNIEQVMINKKITKYQLAEEIDKVNNQLGAEKIRVVDNQLLVPEGFKQTWTELKRNFTKTDVFLQEERIFAIIIFTFIRQNYTLNVHYQDLLQLSKNSVLSEIKNVKELCQRYEVTFLFSRKNGYEFNGDEGNIRRVLEHSLNCLLNYSTGDWVIQRIFKAWEIEVDVDRVFTDFMNVINRSSVNLVQSRVKNLAYLFISLRYQMPNNVATSSKYNFTPLHLEIEEISKEICTMFHLSKSSFELGFVTTRLMASMEGTYSFENMFGLQGLTEEIIEVVCAISGSHFENKPALATSLYEHLVPAYYRLKYDIPLSNPFTYQIQTQYSELFTIVRKGLKPLQNKVGKPIPDDEVAFFTIHFGGYLEYTTSKRNLKALVVCPNGISSSLILNNRLKEIFPSIEFHGVHQMIQIDTISKSDYDMVFSTTHITTEKNLYITKPIMNHVEVNILKSQVYRDFDVLKPEAEMAIPDIIEVVKKHTTIKNETELYTDLSRLLDKRNQTNKEGKTLTELLPMSVITFSSESYTWREAIAKASEPLLVNKSIEAEYVDAMIESAENLGPYMVLAPHVAVPHARPEKGVNTLGISLLHLSKPVDFNFEGDRDEDKMVQLIFVLAAADNTSHLTALQQLATILEDEENICRLIATKNSEEMYQAINSILQKEEEKND